MKIWFNGGLCEESQARVSVIDHGFLYGDGVYETLRVHRGRPLFLREHLARLRSSCRLIRLPLPWPGSLLARRARKTLLANRLEEAVLRMNVSRGPGPVGFDTRDCKTPTLVMMERPLPDYPPALFKQGVTAAVVKTRRNHPLCLPPEAKSTNCLNGILAKQEAVRLGAFEGILLNLSGFVAEGTVSNVFAVRAGRLLTPHRSCGLLAGVTRNVIIRLARKEGIVVREVEMTLSEFARSSEVFLTNSLFGVMPVTKFAVIVSGAKQSRRVGDGKVGPVAKLLAERYRRAIGVFF